MRHRLSASTRRGRFSGSVGCAPSALARGISRQGPMSSACKPACRLSESVGSLLGLWLIDTWSEPS
jgi:hypothetical protein